MDFADIADIDRARALAGINQKVLCQRADVNQSTYSQLKKGHREAYARTLRKLRSALAELVEETERSHG